MALPFGLSPTKDAVLSLSILLAMLIAMAVAVAMALYLPVWASVSITVGTVASMAIGGPALLAKAAAAAVVLGAGAWSWRRRAKRRENQASTRDARLVAIPDPRASGKPARPRNEERERRAA